MTPSKNHGRLQGKIIYELAKLEKYEIFGEVTLSIEEKDYVPDISIFSKLSSNWLEDEIKMVEMPLGAIEILSPTQGTQEIIEKFKTYFKAGIKSCWLVIPPLRSIAISFESQDLQIFSTGILKDEILDIQLPLPSIFS